MSASTPMPREDASPADAETDRGLRRQAPPWLISGLIHFVLVLAAALFVGVAPRGADVEPNRAGGIVLVDRNRGQTQYLSEGDEQAAAAGAITSGRTASSLADALPKERDLSLDLAGVLPSRTERIGGLGKIGDALPGADGFTESGGSKPGSFGGSETQTSVFGVQGRGSKFVYVFDRSGSMEGFGGRPISAAKRELVASLEDFESVHQFQIIFYNEKPKVFNPDRHKAPRMMWGTETEKRAAQKFVRSILPAGGTRHMEALEMALALQPDVIFFLTDADEPRLTGEELAQIRRWNRAATSINAIEFGSDPAPSPDNFLMRLAEQNGGGYKYQDVTELPKP